MLAAIIENHCSGQLNSSAVYNYETTNKILLIAKYKIRPKRSNYNVNLAINHKSLKGWQVCQLLNPGDRKCLVSEQ